MKGLSKEDTSLLSQLLSHPDLSLHMSLIVSSVSLYNGVLHQHRHDKSQLQVSKRLTHP
jgi:hypothetical protein